MKAERPTPPPTRHLVVALAEERPDLLSQTVGLLRRRAFKLEAITTGPSHEPFIARLTFTLEGSDAEAERLVRELGRLLYVLKAENLTARPTVVRELALIKVAATAAERAQVAQLCEVFRGRVVDVGTESVTVEATGDQGKINGLVAMLRPFEILEIARTGPVALGRADHILDNDTPPSTWLEGRRERQQRQAS
ncbi:MAG: acetolactate synthase small subunit [Acidobacteriota bacterium]